MPAVDMRLNLFLGCGRIALFERHTILDHCPSWVLGDVMGLDAGRVLKRGPFDVRIATRIISSRCGLLPTIQTTSAAHDIFLDTLYGPICTVH